MLNRYRDRLEKSKKWVKIREIPDFPAFSQDFWDFSARSKRPGPDLLAL